MRTFRVFIGHAKSDDDATLATMKTEITEILQRAAVEKGKSLTVECVLGRDDYEANYKRCGSWDAWILDIVTRVDYVTREVVYQAFVVPNRNVGAATARIITTAMSWKRPVIFIEDNDTIRSVLGVTKVSAGFKAGWSVIT